MRRGRLGLYALALILVGGAIAVWNMGSAPSENTPTAASFVFQDWVVRCQAAAQNQVGCGLSQQISDQRTRRPVVQVLLGRAPSGQGHQLVLVLPLGVTIAKGAVLEVGDLKRNVAFTQCLPAGCVVPTPADDALLAKMKGAENARITFDLAGQTAAVPFSLKGFEPAFEKMESHGGIGNAGATWWTSLWNSSETK